jgi:hypothetical protein
MFHMEQFNTENIMKKNATNTTAKPAVKPATEQPPQSKPSVDFAKREANRQLPTNQVLELLKTSMPRQFELAEVVGKWIWIQFAEAPAPQIRAELSQLGFHWNGKRQAWQHPCGQFTAGTPNEPREKYASYFPADTQSAA